MTSFPKDVIFNYKIIDFIQSELFDDFNEILTALDDKILNAKKQNPETDTSALEKQINELVYKLYDLTEEEIGIIEHQ